MDLTRSLSTQKNVAKNRFLRRRSDQLMTDTCQPEQIKDFQETTIVLNKEKTGIGVCIVGGFDTHLGRILVSAINPKGAAGKDGRLQCGDQILAVNENDLRNVNHEEAVSTLRMAKNPVKLTVYRENIERLFTNPNVPEKEFEVVLRKGINDNIGLGVYARSDGKGVFITYIAPGSLAESCGKFEQGDRILTCNGKDLRTASQQDAANQLKNTFREVRMLVGRGLSVEESISNIAKGIEREAKQGVATVLKENRMRSASDCVPNKETQIKESKRRTITMNEIGEAMNGSTLELISYQSDGRTCDHHNINLGFCDDEPAVEATVNDHENLWNGTAVPLKSTLKQDGKKNARKMDHVSFEMNQIQHVRNSHLMYGEATGM